MGMGQVIGYPNKWINWMVNAKDRLKSVVPQVLNFDPQPYDDYV